MVRGMDMHLAQLEEMKLTELYKLAKEYEIPSYGQLKKKELIFAILRAQAERGGLMGVLTADVLEQAVHRTVQWRSQGISASVAVNMSWFEALA